MIAFYCHLFGLIERFIVKQQPHPQYYSAQNPPLYTQGHDVDFKELFKAVWEGRLTIVVVTVLFTLVSVCFALFSQEWWSSEAKIAQAQSQNITEYQQQVKQFQPVFNIYQDDGTVLVSKELDRLVDSKVLFQDFINTFDSANNKRTFLDSSEKFQDFKRSISSGEMTDDAIRKLYDEWFDRVSVSVVDKNNRNSPYFIRFQTMTKQDSFDLLTSYISVTEARVHQDAFNNLQAVINGKRNELIQQKRIIQTQAKNQLLVETERAKYAMGIAKAAGVDKPIQTGNSGEIFGIDLGSKGLQAKVQALESVKNLSVIEPRLHQINAKLDMLNNLKINRNVKFQTFRFLENVEQPITRDKPKRTLIVLVGAFLGGMFGLLIVLFRFAFRKEV